MYKEHRTQEREKITQGSRTHDRIRIREKGISNKIGSARNSREDLFPLFVTTRVTDETRLLESKTM